MTYQMACVVARMRTLVQIYAGDRLGLGWRVDWGYQRAFAQRTKLCGQTFSSSQSVAVQPFINDAKLVSFMDAIVG